MAKFKCKKCEVEFKTQELLNDHKKLCGSKKKKDKSQETSETEIKYITRRITCSKSHKEGEFDVRCIHCSKYVRSEEELVIHEGECSLNIELSETANNLGSKYINTSEIDANNMDNKKDDKREKKNKEKTEFKKYKPEDLTPNELASIINQQNKIIRKLNKDIKYLKYRAKISMDDILFIQDRTNNYEVVLAMAVQCQYDSGVIDTLFK